MTEAVSASASSSWSFRWKASWKAISGQLGTTAVSVLGGLALWHFAAARTSPLFLPSPEATWDAALELIEDGTLQAAIAASAGRIAAGWGLGVLFGIPLGIFMGRFEFVRRLLDPYIEFFRFIPPIAFVTLAVIWLGPGEWAKVSLIFYTTIFIVTLNTIAGVQAVSALRLRAAASLGAGPMQALWTVIVPSTVPYMVTGARIAMGNSFLTVISAEIVAAQQGLGSLIWTARNFSRTEWVFVGIIALGLLGFAFDRVLRLAAGLLRRRYGVKI
jgi:NitT/TauT family transport system permease protein